MPRWQIEKHFRCPSKIDSSLLLIETFYTFESVIASYFYTEKNQLDCDAVSIIETRQNQKPVNSVSKFHRFTNLIVTLSKAEPNYVNLAIILHFGCFDRNRAKKLQFKG